MKKKGFTLVELLVVIVILGIITGISIPIIRNIQARNAMKQYTTYMDTIKVGAKLYVDSYGRDLFGDEKSGCALIRYSQMAEKGIIKDIPIGDVSCNTQDTYVKVAKVNDKYGYAPTIACGAVGNDGKVKVDTQLPEDGLLGFDICGVDNKTIMYFFADPGVGEQITYQRRNVKVFFVSNTGINEDISVYYSFIKDPGHELDATAVSPSSLIGGWKKLDIVYVGANEQKRQIEEGTTIILESNTVQTPQGLTGDYFLIVRVDKLKDLAMREWNTDPALSNYAIFGHYRVDNTNPVFSDDSIVVSTNANYNDIIPKLKISATDNYSNESLLRMCTYYDNNSSDCSLVINDIKRKQNGWEDYNPNKTLNRIQNEYDGSNHKVHILVGDAAGNYEEKIVDYKIATRYTITYDSNEGEACNPSSKYVTFDNDPPAWGELCSPKRTYYTFQKWKDSNGTEISSTTTATGNITVYAEWKDTTKPKCTTSKGTPVKNQGIPVTITCTDQGDGCASGQTRTENNIKKDTEFTVKDKAGNEGKCKVQITETDCDCVDGTECIERKSCYHCSSGTHYTAGGSHFCCIGNMPDDNEQDCELYYKWCSGISRCGTDIKMATYGQSNSCDCNKYKQICDKCYS